MTTAISEHKPRAASSRSWAIRLAIVASALLAQVGFGAQWAQALPRTHCDIVGCNYPDSIPPADKTIPASANPVRDNESGIKSDSGGAGQMTAWFKGAAECELFPSPGGCGFPELWGTDWLATNRITYRYELDRMINPQTGETVATLAQMADLLWDSFYMSAARGGDAPFQMMFNDSDNHYVDADAAAAGAPYETVRPDTNGQAQCLTNDPSSCSSSQGCFFTGPAPSGLCQSHQNHPADENVNPGVSGLAGLGPDPSDDSGWIPFSDTIAEFRVWQFCPTPANPDSCVINE